MTFSETQKQITETQLLINTPPNSWPLMAKLQDYLRARCGCKFSALASADLKMLVQTVVKASIAHLNPASITSSISSSVAANAASACPHDEAQM
jgi:hypothetical protein